jgi:hypothetical protein
VLAALVVILTVPMVASGAPPAAPTPLVSSTIPGAQIVPLINSGDVRNGVTFEGIPDGLGIVPVGDGFGQIDIFVAFEQSHVPFSGFADFEDSSVQRVRLNLDTLKVTSLQEVLPPSAGFVRFCSAFMAGPDEGFDDYTFFVNEESVDWLPVPSGASYGSDPAITPFRQAGYSVAIDAKSGDFQPIPGMGRHNHENTVIVPGGWDETVSLSGDDTFAAPSSQLYMYNAGSPDELVGDQGTLYAFQVTGRNGTPLDDPYDKYNDANDYLEIAMGDSLQGRFIEVPPAIADGTTGVAPQQALETWSNDNNVFQFVRIEDMAYDPDNPRTVYFADTGTTRLKEDPGTVEVPSTGRLIRAGSSAFPYFNSDGRIFRMDLNAADPTVVDSLSILAQGLFQEQTGASTFVTIDPGVGFVNPDNMDVGHTSLMVQEDGIANNDVWQHPLGTSTWTKVASATQTASAETSGIIDASDWLGAGWWILDVQSHANLPGTVPAGVWGDNPATEPIYPLGPALNSAYSLRREMGQLLLLKIPGS